jgi:hypothetical protein
MREQLKLNQRLRQILTAAADKLEKALNTSDDPSLCIKIIETLGLGLTNQSKAVDNTAKHVLPNEVEKESQEESDIMKLLTGGK